MNHDPKAYLARYGQLTAYIKARCKEIDELRQSLIPASMDYSGIVVQSSPSDRMSAVMAQIDEMERRIESDTQRTIAVLRDIERTISEVPDLTLRTLLINRYVNGMTWEQTAAAMGYDVRRMYDLHGKALDAVSKIINA